MMQRRATALAAAAVIALISIMVLRAAGSETAPATGAARLVPADALAYVHVSSDRGRDGVQRALSLARRFPAYARARDRLLGRLAVGGRGLDFQRDLAPWVGREVALALLNTSGQTAGSLVIVSVADRARAEAFLRRAGAASTTAYRGTAISRYGRVSSAFVGRYLAVGQEAAIRAAINGAAGRTAPLTANPTYRRATRSLPAGRFMDAYASPGGVRRLLRAQGGLLGGAGILLDQPDLAGAGLAATATDSGLRLTVRSVRDPALLHGHKPVFGSFEPSLNSAVPRTAMAYIGITGLDRAAGRLLALSAAAGSTGARVQRLLQTRGRDIVQRAGVDLNRDVLPLFRGEVALWLAPSVPAPYLTLIARTSHEQQTRVALGRLQAPLVQTFQPPDAGPGQAPTFAERDVDGVKAFSLALATGVEVDYAVFDGKVVISTSLEGIRAVKRAGGRLADADSYRATLGNHPKRVTSLVFLDFSQLLGLGERTGLNASPRYLALRDDLRRVRALGAASSGGDRESTTELFLQIK